MQAFFENFDLFSEKCVKPKIGQNGQKMGSGRDFQSKMYNFLFYLEGIFMQKYTTFFTNDFWPKPFLKILTFFLKSTLDSLKLVMPEIGQNGQKMGKQMSGRDFYAKHTTFFTIDFWSKPLLKFSTFLLRSALSLKLVIFLKKLGK